MTRLAVLRDEIHACRRCPRLVEHRESVAIEKRRAYRDQTYWGRPVAGFGDGRAPLIVVGLAPGAHGANRTGRVFTGDRSGDFLYAALHRAGLANQAESSGPGDGLTLRGVYVLCPVRCAPPDNAPLAEEIATCSDFFDRELALLPRRRRFLALGALAFSAVLDHLARLGVALPTPRPKFGHGVAVSCGPYRLHGSYHVSQQNTQTGRLTAAMFDEVLRAALEAPG